VFSESGGEPMETSGKGLSSSVKALIIGAAIDLQSFHENSTPTTSTLRLMICICYVHGMYLLFDILELKWN